MAMLLILVNVTNSLVFIFIIIVHVYQITGYIQLLAITQATMAGY